MAEGYLNKTAEFFVPNVVNNRVEITHGGYYKIDKLVFVNVNFTLLTTTSSDTDSLLSGFPKPASVEAFMNVAVWPNVYPNATTKISNNNLVAGKAYAINDNVMVSGLYICE